MVTNNCPRCSHLLLFRQDDNLAYLQCFPCGKEYYLRAQGEEISESVENHLGGYDQPVDVAGIDVWGEGTHSYLYNQDTGCDISPSCLNCPLDWCKYDVPHQQIQTYTAILRAKEYQAEVEALEATGLARAAAVVEVALRHGVTDRTVYRSIQKLREKEAVS